MQDAASMLGTFPQPFVEGMAGVGPDGASMSLFSTILTPNSGSDIGFQYLLDLGWESLDTIGAPMTNYDLNGYGIS